MSHLDHDFSSPTYDIYQQDKNPPGLPVVGPIDIHIDNDIDISNEGK